MNKSTEYLAMPLVVLHAPLNGINSRASCPLFRLQRRLKTELINYFHFRENGQTDHIPTRFDVTRCLALALSNS